MEFRSGEKKRREKRQKNERGPFALAAIAVNYIGGKEEEDWRERAGGRWICYECILSVRVSGLE